MSNYIDGFVFPLKRNYVKEYQQVAEAVAEIWKEHGALAYFEYVGDDMKLEGTRSFPEVIGMNDDEVIIFGWVVFPSREIRDQANEQVPKDERMAGLIEPLVDPSRVVFDVSKMVYGGFQQLI